MKEAMRDRRRLRKLQETLMADVDKLMSKMGFSYIARRRTFEKPTDFGRVSLSFTVVLGGIQFDVAAHVGLRFDAVENICGRNRPMLSEREKGDTFTFGCELGNLAGTGWKTRRVADAVDARKVARAIVKDFQKIGVPYLEKAADANAMLAILSEDCPEAGRNYCIGWACAEIAVALSLWLKGEQAAREMYLKKLAYLEKRQDPNIKFFREFGEVTGLAPPQ
jgi:hypothetical protein